MTENNNQNKEKINKITDPSQLEYHWDETFDSPELLSKDLSLGNFKTLDVVSFIKKRCLEYTGNKPLELAVEIMNNPIIRMHGAEHHYLTPAVLLTVFNNLSKKYPNLSEKLDELEVYINNNAPRTCSLEAGTCGAAIGSGVFFINFMQEQFTPKELDRLSNYIRTESIRQIDEIGLSRCCKRDTYISLMVASKVMRENLNLDIEISEPKCTFSLRNKSCGMEECPFFNLSNLIG